MTTLVNIADDAHIPSGHSATGASTIPAEIAARLSQEQITQLNAMLAARATPHPVDYRVSSSLFGRRFYVAFFAGTEARAWDRLRNEGHIRPISTVLRDGAVTSMIVTLALCVLTGAIFGALHVLKWTTGFNFLLS